MRIEIQRYMHKNIRNCCNSPSLDSCSHLDLSCYFWSFLSAVARAAQMDAGSHADSLQTARRQMAAALRADRAAMQAAIAASERRRHHARRQVLLLRAKLRHLTSRRNSAAYFEEENDNDGTGHQHDEGHYGADEQDEADALTADDFDSDLRPTMPAAQIARQDAALAAADAADLRRLLIDARAQAHRALAECAQLRTDRIALAQQAAAAAAQCRALRDECACVRAEAAELRVEYDARRLADRLNEAQQSLAIAQRAQVRVCV